MPQQFEPDEFDEIADQGGPVGVHRAPRSLMSRLLPVLLTFVIAGAIALVLVLYLWNRDIGPDITPDPAPTSTTTTTPSPDPTTEPTPTDEATASPEPTVTDDPEPVVIEDAQIHVRNGAGVAGLAGTNQELLEAAGFTNIEANNIDAADIPGGQNVVIYSEDRLADTAQAVADALSIDAVDAGDTPGGAEIEVLLASDPTG